MAKAGKIPFPKMKITEKKPIISLGKKETDFDKKKKERFLGFLNEKTRKEELSKPIISEKDIVRRQKTKEIKSHLKMVILTCCLCLVILGGLYYFEKSNNWLERLNSQLEKAIKEWDWKL